MGEITGGCHCGKVRYAIEGAARHTSVCHCRDCRRSSGAPFVGWLGVASTAFRVTQGEPRQWSSNGEALRYFCGDCGTGLYYVNETMLPGLVDAQSATLDDPDAQPPQVQIQTADKLAWSDGVPALPGFARFPG